MKNLLLWVCLSSLPALAAEPVVALGVAGHGWAGPRLESVYGPAIEFDLDAALGHGERLGLRLRGFGLFPGLFEGHVGLGYRHLFRSGHALRPFFGVTGALVVSNECLANACTTFGAAVSGEGGIEVALGHRMRLYLFGALFGRIGWAPLFVPMPSLWVGLGW